ncbi:MAG: hypothetical protein K1X94_24205 [Sandaracinaceae bacterium]|nr:hypothetical protein [Sandaracinaceae bacterium]
MPGANRNAVSRDDEQRVFGARWSALPPELRDAVDEARRSHATWCGMAALRVEAGLLAAAATVALVLWLMFVVGGGRARAEALWEALGVAAVGALLGAAAVALSLTFRARDSGFALTPYGIVEVLAGRCTVVPWALLEGVSAFEHAGAVTTWDPGTGRTSLGEPGTPGARYAERASARRSVRREGVPTAGLVLRARGLGRELTPFFGRHFDRRQAFEARLRELSAAPRPLPTPAAGGPRLSWRALVARGAVVGAFLWLLTAFAVLGPLQDAERLAGDLRIVERPGRGLTDDVFLLRQFLRDYPDHPRATAVRARYDACARAALWRRWHDVAPSPLAAQASPTFAALMDYDDVMGTDFRSHPDALPRPDGSCERP